MEPQRQPNRWTCLPTSFAMACDVPLEHFLSLIGHDGSEIQWPALQEPLCRRAFHVQECIWAASLCGYTVTPYECDPQLAPCQHATVLRVEPWWRIDTIIKGFGVITGEVKRGRHAVAFDFGIIYDPNGVSAPYNPDYLKPETIFRFDLISF